MSYKFQSASAETESELRTELRRPRVWFIDAPTDLLFCCGGLLWILIGLHATFVSRAHVFALPGANGTIGEQGLAFLLMAGSYFFTYSHHAATWVRLYGNEKSRRKYWYCSFLLPAILLAGVIATLLKPTILPLLVQITIAWNIQHWVAQSYGIGLIYMSRAKFDLSKLDRNLLWISCQLLIVIGIFKSEIFSNTQLAFVGKTFPVLPFVPKSLISSFELGALAVWIPISIYFLCKWIKRKTMPPIAAIAIAVTIARIMLNSSSSCVDLMVYGLPFFHSLQYLVITSRFNTSEKNIFPSREFPPLSAMMKSSKLLQYLLFLLVAGSLVYGGSQFVVEKIGGTEMVSWFALYLIMLINFHHVISDAFIWKLRDPEIGKHF